jgi:hypothetical protein
MKPWARQKLRTLEKRQIGGARGKMRLKLKDSRDKMVVEVGIVLYS